MSNGIGWRSVLFVSGCPHHCEGCQNKQTWNENYGKKFNKDYYLSKILNNKIINGITLSGGEPLTIDHIKELIPFCSDIKKHKLTIWCYTGFTFEELIKSNDKYIKEMLELIDVLIDGRFVNELKDGSLQFRGSSNQRIIDVQKSLKQEKIILWKDEF